MTCTSQKAQKTKERVKKMGSKELLLNKGFEDFIQRSIHWLDRFIGDPIDFELFLVLNAHSFMRPICVHIIVTLYCIHSRISLSIVTHKF